MHRNWRTWIIFVATLMVVLVALGWMTHHAQNSGRRAVYEENVRLAL